MLKARKHLNEAETQYFLLQIIDAIAYLHNNCIIHRDLKLANIMLDDNLNIKIGDFGLSAKINEANERKKTMCGTPNYLAPEIVERDLRKQGYSYEVDIWAFGVIAYNLLFGSSPFEGETKDITYYNIKSNDVKFPNDIYVSNRARIFIRQLLTKDPGSRLKLSEMPRHLFFSEIDPPKSLPKSIFTEPYVLSSYPQNQVRRSHGSSSGISLMIDD